MENEKHKFLLGATIVGALLQQLQQPLTLDLQYASKKQPHYK